jgi:hypothetical protein
VRQLSCVLGLTNVSVKPGQAQRFMTLSMSSCVIACVNASIAWALDGLASVCCITTPTYVRLAVVASGSLRTSRVTRDPHDRCTEDVHVCDERRYQEMTLIVSP